MNKKEECDIVKDLSSLHIDNMLSKNSKEFVDKHLKECEDCQKYYEDMNADIFYEEGKEKINDQTEVDHLKKVNKKMTTLKWIIAGILWGILALVLIMYVRMCYINNIVDDTVSKILMMGEISDNYKLTCKETYSNANTDIREEYEITYFYKDGKNKEVTNYYRNGTKVDEKIRFIEDYSYNKITVFPMLKQIDYQEQDFIEVRKGNGLAGLTSKIVSNQAGINNLGVYVVTDDYGGKECWVIKNKKNEGYTHVYIEKETKDILRVVECYYSYYRENIYKLEEDIVTDEDVDSSILETDAYSDYTRNNITYKLDETMREFYEKY